MPNEQDGAKISQAYQEHRPYLVDLAFRMLGCRPPGAWDRRFANGMGPARARLSVGCS